MRRVPAKAIVSPVVRLIVVAFAIRNWRLYICTVVCVAGRGAGSTDTDTAARIARRRWTQEIGAIT